MATGVTFDILSLNTKGLRDKLKRNKLFIYAKNHLSANGILFMQETHSCIGDELSWSTQFDGKMWFSHGANNSRGVLIGISKDLEYVVEKECKDLRGRFIILKCVIQGTSFLLINIYNDNIEADQVKTLEDLKVSMHDIDIEQECKIVSGGDYNLIFDINLDSSGGKPRLKLSSVSKVCSINEDFDLIDIWRIRNPHRKRFTYRQRTPLIQRRLDYFFISNQLQESVVSIDIISAICTDHSALYLKINDNAATDHRGPSYWKFNNSLLHDGEFVLAMQQEIIKLKNNREAELADPRVWWEYMKYSIRKFCQNYSKKAAKEISRQIKELERKPNTFSALLADNPCNETLNNFESAKAELNNHYSYVTEGIIMRSRVQWYEKGEKNNKYFLNLEKRNKMRSSVRKLIVNGTVVLNPEKVLSEVRAYYTNLYSRRSLHTEKDCSEYLANLNCPILTEDERRACEGMLSQGEIYNSLKDLPANKTPGNDGLSKEFYLAFYDLLGKDLQECYKHSFEKGKLAPSQYQAVIVLIEKRGKDKRYIRNWRPISLLNVDTKILSKALASRLKKVIA